MIRRAALQIFAGLLLVIFFGGIACTLWVRAAVRDGAMEQPYTCLNARHFDAWKAGNVTSARQLGLLASQVRKHHLAGQRVGISNWHQLGIAAELGAWLGFSKSQRQQMFIGVVQRMTLCPQDVAKYRVLQVGGR